MTKARKDFQRIRAVVFDMDGTLVCSDLNFDRIRAEGGVPDGTPILEFLKSSSGSAREKAQRVLLDHEDRAARGCTLLPGARKLLEALRSRGYALALLTRNSRASVDIVLKRHRLQLDACVAREDAEPKPSPEPVLKIAEMLALNPSELLVVGDYVFDVQCGQAAGARTALLQTEKQLDVVPPPDVTVDRLTDLLDHLPERAPSAREQSR